MRDDSEMSQGDDSLVPTHATMAETFADRLSQALEKSSGMKGQSVTQTMNQIVEQVVRQVRIRVMPETTSMELQLKSGKPRPCQYHGGSKRRNCDSDDGCRKPDGKRST